MDNPFWIIIERPNRFIGMGFVKRHHLSSASSVQKAVYVLVDKQLVTHQQGIYEIYDKFDTKESDTTYYNRDTNGKREISLVTCRQNNDYRLVLLAREAE